MIRRIAAVGSVLVLMFGGLVFATGQVDASAFSARISTAFAAFLPGAAAETPPRAASIAENFGSAPCVGGEKTWDGDGATNNWAT